MTTAHLPPTDREPRGLREWLLPLGISLALSVALVTPFFWLGTASGHDFEFHASSWLDAAYQWKEGILYPRWTAWTNHGFGEPRFIFYPPLSWILGGVLTLVLPDPGVPILFIVLVETLGGLSAYLLLRRLAVRRAALLAAACYVVNPNTLLMTYVRSDFAEQLACALFPLLLLSALRLCGLLEDSPPRPALIAQFALPFAAVWLSNAPAGVISSYSVALLIAWAAIERRSGRVLARGAAGIVLGLGLASFYLVPAAYEQRWVNIGQALSSGLLPVENFLFTAIDNVEHTWFNWISSICALSTILLFGLAALCSRRLAGQQAPATRNRQAFQAIFVVGVAATLLMLRFTLPVWNLLPKLRFVQFPWRWMSIVALGCACFLAAVMENRRGWVWLVGILVLSVPLGGFLVKNTWWDADEMPTMQEGVASQQGFDGTDEYDPLGDDHLNLPSEAPLAKVLPRESAAPAGVQIQIQQWTTEDREIRVKAPAPFRLALRLLNYPAWRVEVNGKAVEPGRMDDVNQMVIPVDAGDSVIRVRFVRTRDRQAGNAISLGSLLVGAVLLGSRRAYRTR